MLVVNYVPTLRAMAKAGHIKLHEQTGTKIYNAVFGGKAFTCHYIDEAVNSSTFEFKGKVYQVKYVSGCFCPYVFQLSGDAAYCKETGKFAFMTNNKQAVEASGKYNVFKV